MSIMLNAKDLGIDIVLNNAVRLWISPDGCTFRYEMPSGNVVVVPNEPDTESMDNLKQARIDYAVGNWRKSTSVNLHPNYGKQYEKGIR